MRAVLPGYSTSRRELVQVLPASPAWQAFRLSRLSTAETVLGEQQVQAAGFPGVTPESPEPTDHDHSSVAWRLRHLKRSVLRDEGPQPVDTQDGEGDLDAWLAGEEVGRLGRASSPASGQSLSVGWLPNLPVSGQVQLLTTSSFDSAQQLFSAANVPAGVAYIALGSQVGSRSNWAAQVAIAQGELSSWALSGNYEVTLASRHALGVSVAYGAQRYEGGNPFALAAVSLGDRNAGALDVVDHWTLGPTATVTLGTRFSRYGYVDGGPAMWSPSAEFRWAPVRGNTIRALVSQQMTAPGAEEFVPTPVGGLWLPSQRTFSTLISGTAFRPERTRHVELGFERELGALVVSARAYKQSVDDQIVTLFGMDDVEQPRASLAHYFVASGGDVAAAGWGVGISRPVGSRFRGSLDYSSTHADWTGSSDMMWAALWAPSARRTSERINDFTTSFETNIPETATRVFTLYRLSTGYARSVAPGAAPGHRRPLRRPGQPAPSVPRLHDGRVGSAGRRAEPVPRERRRDVGLRRTARRASAEAHRRRRAGSLLAAVSASFPAGRSPHKPRSLCQLPCGLSIALDATDRHFGSGVASHGRRRD